MLMDNVTFPSFIRFKFSHVRRLPSSPSDLLLKVIATCDQMKLNVTLRKRTDFSSWNTVGNIWDNVNTELNDIYNEGLVFFRHINAEFLYIIRQQNDKICRLEGHIANFLKLAVLSVGRKGLRWLFELRRDCFLGALSSLSGVKSEWASAKLYTS